MICRFLGLETVIEGHGKLDRFGQRIELPEQLANEIGSVNAPILPDDLFVEIGFTNEELRDFATPGSHVPIEFVPSGDDEADNKQRAVIAKQRAFLEKKKVALVALHEWRESLAAWRKAGNRTPPPEQGGGE